MEHTSHHEEKKKKIDTYTYKEAGRRRSKRAQKTGLTEEIPPDHTTQQTILANRITCTYMLIYIYII